MTDEDIELAISSKDILRILGKDQFDKIAKGFRLIGNAINELKSQGLTDITRKDVIQWVDKLLFHE